VLVVEDHDDTRELIAGHLGDHGAMVLMASDGPSARAVLAKTTVDLIVTDISMPGETGIQMMNRVRAIAALVNVPAIAISGAIQPEELEDFRPALFQAVIAKPFDLQRLVAIASELIGS
jgi:CheY-like chemotaxis protein